MSHEREILLVNALRAARVFAWDADFVTGRVVMSDNVSEVLGLPSGLTARPNFLVGFVHPDDRDWVLASVLQASGMSESIQFRAVRPDNGEVVWLEGRSEALRDAQGERVGSRGLFVDITARKHAEEGRAAAELRERDAKSHLEALVEHAPDTVAHLDVDGTIRFVNRPPRPLTLDDVVGKPFEEFIRTSERARLRAALADVVSSRRPTVIEVPHDIDEGERWWSAHVGPIVRDGEVTGAVVIARDITAQKHAEAQQWVTDRMVALGTMAAGVAHEINNPLAAMVANAELAANIVSGLAPGPDIEELLVMLKDCGVAATRVRDVVRDLKLFAGAEEDRVSDVDVRATVETTLRMASNEIRHRARVVRALDEVPPVAANESRLGQVFLNLLINAAQAIPEGRAEHNEIRVATRLDASGQVAVDISDTGVGMSDEVRNRLFTPFFTTKPIGVGTGLGLSICRRIVSTLGGEIRVRTTLGVGSTFTVLLRPSVCPRATPAAPDLVAPSTRRARVLVVDDEVVVAQAIQRVLRRDHDLAIETEARHALARIARGERFDLIFCDLMMPQMTGMDLYEEVLRVAPDQADRITFVTGGAFTSAARAFISRVGNPVLEKPFRVSDVKAAVEARLR